MSDLEFQMGDLFRGLALLFNAEELDRIIERVAHQVGLEILSITGDTYPPPPPPRFPNLPRSQSPIRTEKQKRWWWAMMHAIATGGTYPDSLQGWRATYRKVKGRKTLVISGQYKRTGTLVRSINYDVQRASGEGVTLIVGPTAGREQAGDVANYASYVIDEPPSKGYQARIHQGRWKPLAQILVEHEQDILAAFEDALEEELRGIFGSR